MIEVSMQVQEVLSRRGLLVEELDQVFAELDTDGNHELDWGEFKDALEMLGVNLDVERARLLFTMFDEDESGTVAFSEFTAKLFPNTDWEMHESFKEKQPISARRRSKEQPEPVGSLGRVVSHAVNVTKFGNGVLAAAKPARPTTSFKNKQEKPKQASGPRQPMQGEQVGRVVTQAVAVNKVGGVLSAVHAPLGDVDTSASAAPRATNSPHRRQRNSGEDVPRSPPARAPPPSSMPVAARLSALELSVTKCADTLQKVLTAREAMAARQSEQQQQPRGTVFLRGDLVEPAPRDSPPGLRATLKRPTEPGQSSPLAPRRSPEDAEVAAGFEVRL